MSEERWLPVVGFPDYEVSDRGRVRGVARIRMNRGRRQQWPARILKPYKGNRFGHLQVGLYREGGRGQESLMVHRLVLEAFVGPCPPGMEARHYPERDPTNNRLENLRWGTHAENAADKVLQGTRQRGEAIGTSKLKEAQVAEIKRRLSLGEMGLHLAREFGVTQATMSSINRGQSWAWVTVPETGGIRDTAALEG